MNHAWITGLLATTLQLAKLQEHINLMHHKITAWIKIQELYMPIAARQWSLDDELANKVEKEVFSLISHCIFHLNSLYSQENNIHRSSLNMSSNFMRLTLMKCLMNSDNTCICDLTSGTTRSNILWDSLLKHKHRITLYKLNQRSAPVPTIIMMHPLPWSSLVHCSNSS